MSQLTHFNESGGAHMVDVGNKSDTNRMAVATGRIRMKPETVDLIRSGTASKGDVLGVAQVAGIMAAKNTPQIIPMCHFLMLTGTDIEFEILDDAVEITAIVKTIGKTGVEMEALTAVGVAALTVYDMVKAVDRAMVIESIQVESKSGGVSGEWQRKPVADDTCDDGMCTIPTSGGDGGVNLGAIAGLRMAGTPTNSTERSPNS